MSTNAPKTGAVAPTSRQGITVKRGRVAAPIRALIYGPEGVGKTSLGIDAPDNVLIDVEGGSLHLDAARYEFRPGEPNGFVPKTYAEITTALERLCSEEHGFKSVTIDTLDRIESMLWAHIVERDRAKKRGGSDLESIEDYGYGKGYTFALDEWRAFVERLDRLHSRRAMTIILIGHTAVRTWKNPEGEDFDRYVLRVHDKAAGFLKEWADVVGFFNFETFAEAETDKRGKRVGRPKGFASGRRVLRVERTAAFDAKARVPLPATIEVAEDHPWAPFAAAILEGQTATPDQIVASIKTECERIGDPELTERVRVAVSAKPAPDVVTLQRYLNSLRGRPAVGA